MNTDTSRQQPVDDASHFREKRAAEDVLRDQGLLFQAVFEVTSDAMAISTADGTVIAANPAYYRLYGYSAQEVLGQNFTLIFPEEERAYAQELYTYMFHSPVISPAVEGTARRADGTELFVETRYSFITRNGERIAMISFIRDITERQKSEEALRGSQQLLQFIMETTGISLWEWDIESSTVRVSSNLKRAIGLRLDAAIVTFQDFLNALVAREDQPLFEQKMRQILEEEEDGEFQIDFRTPHTDSNAPQVRCYGQVIYDETGKAIRITAISPDISSPT